MDVSSDAGRMDIRPPRLEDAGLEDSALPLHGIQEEFHMMESAHMESACDLVTEEFRHVGNKDEWPVWGSLQHAVEDQPEADHLIASPELLVEFLSRFFLQRILEIVRVHLAATRHSWLGQRYNLRGTYGSYAKSMIREAVEYLDNMVTTASGGRNRGRSGQGSAGREGDSAGAGGAGGDGERGRGRRRGRGRGRRRESNSARTGGSGDGGDRGGKRQREPANAAVSLYDFGHGIRGYKCFSSVEVKDVITTCWTTPKKNSAGSELSISRRSHEFVELVNRIWEIPDKYDPSFWAGDQSYVYLYHGTRTSSIPKFQLQGIFPPSPIAQDFSKEPAFYTTNMLRVAYEHVLHQRPRLDRDASTRDTVSILVFKVPSAILHGDSACKDDYYFRPEWFSDQEDERWGTFCKMNWNSRVATMTLPEFDVVSGAISEPERLTPGSRVTEVSPVMDPDTGERPQQVVLTSKMSQSWLASQLILILREVRSPPETANRPMEKLSK